MTDRLRIALAQTDSRPGGLEANAAAILSARAEAAAGGAALVLTPASSLAGAPGDLQRNPGFLAACAEWVARLAEATGDGGPGLVVGAPWAEGDRLHDAALLLEGGRIAARRARHALTPRDPLGAARIFAPGPAPGPIAFRGARLGLMSGEDSASPEVAETLQESGAEILVALGGFPFEAGGEARRLAGAVARVVETGLPLALLNQVGGQDGLVFDGASLVLNADRSLALRLPGFAPALALTDWTRGAGGDWSCAPQPLPQAMAEAEAIYHALLLGLRAELGGAAGAVLALEAGAPAALLAALAVDALGPGRVRALRVPPAGAEGWAAGLGLRVEVLELGPAIAALGLGAAPGLVARLREAALAARAEGAAALSALDKIGMALGEVTPGAGFAPLADLWRGQAAELCRWRNAHRPPGALGPARPGLPEAAGASAAADAILRALVERDAAPEALVAAGHDPALVRELARRLELGEAARRRAPDFLRLTPCAFGRDRRYPTTKACTGLIG